MEESIVYNILQTKNKSSKQNNNDSASRPQ